jgi:hypothetical protein
VSEIQPIEILHVESDDLRQFFVRYTLEVSHIDHRLNIAPSHAAVVNYLGLVTQDVIPPPDVLILNANFGKKGDGSDGRKALSAFRDHEVRIPKTIGLSEGSTRAYGIYVDRDIVRGKFGELPGYVLELASRR